MPDKNPLVSIVVPSYNHAPYIAQCIESIVYQDYYNYELIVLDDVSQDATPQILPELQKIQRFHLELQKNQGRAKTINHGLRDLAKGKYIALCASDDYWLPGKLSKQVKFLEKYPEYAMVFGKTQIVDENNVFDIAQNQKGSIKLKGGSIFKELINIEFHPPVNYMLRASVVKDLGYYREHIWAEDFDMNLRIAEKYPIGYIDEFLSAYRVNNSIPSKSLTFNTIYSHRDSILQFEETAYFKEAIKNWHFRCFTWYAPFTKGKRLALYGMFHSLDKMLTKQFIISFIVLIFKWHKE